MVNGRANNMPISEEWKAALRPYYDALVPRYEGLQTAVTKLLRRELAKTDIEVHAVVGRVKSFESCCAKLIRKGLLPLEGVAQQRRALEALHDLCGVRVVCLFVSQLDQIENLVWTTFGPGDLDRKQEEGPNGAFGYRSNHYVVEVPRPAPDDLDSDFVGMRLEIQVRTVAMDAWASISRSLSYHQGIDIPEELQRDFSAISALMHIADKEFEELRRAIANYRNPK